MVDDGFVLFDDASVPTPAEAFYADPVDKDGKVIGTARMGPLNTPWGPVEPTKVPYDEIVLDPDNTIHVKMPEPDD